LTSETIASDPNSINGVVSYAYDPVGNRTQKTSTLPGMPGGLSNYNANDQLSTDTYDADGNTTASNGNGYVYDFENHLVQQGGISIVYDGDGNRVSKTAGGVTTKYLVDTQNPTGYAQVVYETTQGVGSRQYVYGLERISQLNSSPSLTSYYVYDGHGSVRALTNTTGAVTDTYDYDAFGNLIHSTGSTPNNYLFAGEQFDPDLNLYYNRARYLNVSTGRFWSKDSNEGQAVDPRSLHAYLYSQSDPVDLFDPSGMYSQQFGYDVEDEVQRQYSNDFYAGDEAPLGVSYGGWARVGPPSRSAPYSLKPDIFDTNRRVWAEVKPLSLSGIAKAGAAWGTYFIALSPFGYLPEVKWVADGRIVTVDAQSVLIFNTGGIVFYTTNQGDYELFRNSILGMGAGVAISYIVNTLADSLPRYPSSPSGGSEIVQIERDAQIAVEGTEAETQLDEDLELVP
jgi:RHS repeat-associated protein